MNRIDRILNETASVGILFILFILFILSEERVARLCPDGATFRGRRLTVAPELPDTRPENPARPEAVPATDHERTDAQVQ